MKKEYKAPEMDVIEMEYKPDCLLCESNGSNCSEPPDTSVPFTKNIFKGPLG
jgi:hypothetical protein